MRKYVAITLLMSLAYISAQEPSISQSATDSAIKLLTTTKPIDGGLVTAQMSPDPKLKAERMALFADQMAAIATIAKSHKEVDLKIIFLYLKYTNDIGHLLIWSIRKPELPSDNMEIRRTRWPVFSVILDMPNAAQELESYIYDKNNPLDCRLDAYTILGYLDLDRLKKARVILRAEVLQSSSILDQDRIVKFIDGVEKRKAGYGFDRGVELN